MNFSKVVLVVICTIAALIGLWVVGLLLKVGAALLWLVSIPFLLVSKLLLSQPILFAILVCVSIYWWMNHKRRTRNSNMSFDRSVADLDYRLDRLNEVLSKRY